MILKRVPFRRWHLEWLDERGLAEGISALLDPRIAHVLETQNSWTVVADADPVFIGGTMEVWPGRHMAWAGVSEFAGPHMTAITRHARWIRDQVGGRIELTVRSDFEKGHHWARLLGFDVENPPGLLRNYDAQGADHVAYVRFNEG